MQTGELAYTTTTLVASTPVTARDTILSLSSQRRPQTVTSPALLRDYIFRIISPLQLPSRHGHTASDP